ncbi:MAG: response regulator [Proteobacteria bacterium]|nr:response regulator [Pseudomonadota bacterium]
MRILVVDDFDPMRKSIIEYLQLLDFTNITEADNGVTALEKLQNETVDFVISDWTMPEMDGLELLKTMRADQKLRSIPVLMITAEATPDNILKAVKAGVNNYIVKPINVNTLLQKIEKIFS